MKQTFDRILQFFGFTWVEKASDPSPKPPCLTPGALMARDAMFRLVVGPLDRLRAENREKAAEIVELFKVGVTEAGINHDRGAYVESRLALKFLKSAFEGQAQASGPGLAREAFLSAASHAEALCRSLLRATPAEVQSADCSLLAPRPERC